MFPYLVKFFTDPAFFAERAGNFKTWFGATIAALGYAMQQNIIPTGIPGGGKWAGFLMVFALILNGVPFNKKN